MSIRFSLRSMTASLFIFLPLLSTADDVIDEVIVTADFRERPAREVPASVTVMDAAFTQDVAVQHFEELINIIPNMNWSGDGNRARYFQIRGVGELEQYQGAPNPSIGFLIDDIDFSGIGGVATLFDMQSIEVLRGSQGSRYGANALGGLIYMRSTEPSIERNGRAQLTIGEDDTTSLGVAFGGALNETETTTIRVSAQKHKSNGFRINRYLHRKDTNRRDETVLRARLRFEPSGDFEANAALMYTNIDDGYDAFAIDNSYSVLSDKPGRDAQESLGASLRLDWSGFGEMTLTSVTGFAHSNIDFDFDADWGNDESWDPVTYDYESLNDRKRQTLSQEFRLVSDEWLLGVYALNLSDESVAVNLGDYYDPFFDFADSLNDTFGSDYEATNVALFGQFDHDISDATRLSFGLRVERRFTDYFDTNALEAGPSETMSGGELALSHDISEAVAAYASVSKGYKAGGFNLGVVPPGKRDFGAEEIWSIETGIKSEFLDGNLKINAAVFRSQRDNQQVRTSLQLTPGDPASFVFFTDNIAKGEMTGAEADVHWFASDALQLYANIGLLDASFDSGRGQAHAPRYTLAGGIAYRHSNGVFARVDVTATDDFYFDVSHDQKSTAFELVNARLGYEKDSWLVSLWARNLFDKEYAVRGFYFGNEPPDFPNTLYTRFGDPRQVGITIEKRY